ncbi:MAG TPA: hypothetical protein VLT36_18515 [Candidatus Dormibacteraeota bacterium]|nr:hypothetical protein [Candidatus Dormibacteraeota bacterium]
MTSLPLISHRLFVAAAGSESAVRPAREQQSFGNAQGCATAIPLELLQAEKKPAEAGARPLRTVAPRNKT